MKALVYRSYGGREVYAIEDMSAPRPPARGQVRVNVHASSINPVDAKVRRGELKLIAGRGFPKRPGLDFSGVVDAIGEDVTGIAPGDDVFGAAMSISDGAFAEQVLVKAASIAKKPATVDHATAAGIPTVAIAALQSLRDIVKVSPKQPILVNGCTGGVGLLALQIANLMGAMVTGVCATDSVALARAYGAHHVIDYRTSRVTDAGTMFGAILELSGKLPFAAARALLRPGGVYVDFSPSPPALIGSTTANPFRSRKHRFAMTAANTADLEWLAARIDRGELRAAPTRVLPLAKFAEAFSLAEGGGVSGKVVVSLKPVATGI